MKAKNFNELADRAKAAWSDDARRVYEAASSEFTAEVNERAELGAVLATARKARSLTQPALSELTDIQQAEISRIERGAGNPTAATLLRLADALGAQVHARSMRGRLPRTHKDDGATNPDAYGLVALGHGCSEELMWVRRKAILVRRGWPFKNGTWGGNGMRLTRSHGRSCAGKDTAFKALDLRADGRRWEGAKTSVRPSRWRLP